MLLLPPTPPITYLKLKKIKDQKTRHFTSHKLFYMEIPLEKATFTGHELHQKKNKLFYMEIPLEKATFTGHELHKKKQVILQGNSFGKGDVHWTRIAQLTFVESYSYLAIDD